MGAVAPHPVVGVEDLILTTDCKMMETGLKTTMDLPTTCFTDSFMFDEGKVLSSLYPELVKVCQSFLLGYSSNFLVGRLVALAGLL